MKYMYILRQITCDKEKVSRIWLKGEITVYGSEDSIF